MVSQIQENASYNPCGRVVSKAAIFSYQQLGFDGRTQRTSKLRKNPPYDADFLHGLFVMPFVQENQQRRTIPISTV